MSIRPSAARAGPGLVARLSARANVRGGWERPQTRPLGRRELLARSAAAVATVAVSACGQGDTSAAEQARDGDRKGYVSGDGTIEQVPSAQRGAPIRLEGTTLEGQPWSNAKLTEMVLVLNVWGSWCPPCITEAPDLQKAWNQVRARKLPVQFLGLDKMETPATGLAFQQRYRITYPSLAYDGGVPILSLQGRAVATPTTLVLDTRGRVAARVSGQVTTKTLLGLIEDVLAGN